MSNEVERQTLSVLATLDLEAIADEGVRRALVALLNLVEAQQAELVALRAENQQLRDAIARLQGERGKPTFQPKARPPELGDYSSERERRRPARWQKRSKLDQIVIDRTETLRVDPAVLPADAEFKGYERVVVQDLLLRTDNVGFEKEKWYARSTRQSYLAPLPAGYAGEFGPGIRALALTLGYVGNMSQPKILEVFRGAGVQISAGQVSALLTEGQQRFHAEAAGVVEAGLASSPWQHLDDTSTRVDGQPQYCQVVGNPLFTGYRTTPKKDRLTLLDLLRLGAPRRYRRDARAELMLAVGGRSPRLQQALARLPWGQAVDEATLEGLLAEQRPALGARQQARLREALAIAAYQAQTDGPVVRLLVCDDAPQFRGLTEELALCWIHEGRHYKQLLPWAPPHRQALEEFLTRFWDYYDQLLAYRQQPSATEARRLEAAFDVLFTPASGYRLLDERIALTQAKKVGLLRVLAHPEVPLHNNPAELGARQRVRKRDVSFGPRSPTGTRAWDTFQTLVATCQKLGVSFSQYVQDRLTGAGQVRPLASVLQQRAQQLNLGASWAAS